MLKLSNVQRPHEPNTVTTRDEMIKSYPKKDFYQEEGLKELPILDMVRK